MRMPGISFAMGKRLMLRYSRVSGSLPKMELAGLDACMSKYSRLRGKGDTVREIVVGYPQASLTMLQPALALRTMPGV